MWVVLFKQEKDVGYGNLVDKSIACEIFDSKELAEEYLCSELTEYLGRSLSCNNYQYRAIPTHLKMYFKGEYTASFIGGDETKSNTDDTIELIKEILMELSFGRVYTEIVEKKEIKKDAAVVNPDKYYGTRNGGSMAIGSSYRIGFLM